MSDFVTAMAGSYLPPGFRFHPTDEELIVHYLKKKVAGKLVQNSVIAQIAIYKFEPSDLPGLAMLNSRDPEWFFFNLQDKRARTNRTTRGGYWKATGKDRKISIGTSTIGWKKTLIYHVGRSPSGERTDWIMHEYRLDEEYEKGINGARPFVLCRVRRKGGPGPRNGEQYGAPVLELNEEAEAEISAPHSFMGTEVEVSTDCGDQGPMSNMQPRISKIDNSREDMGLILCASIECEDEQQQQNSEGFVSMDDFLDLLNNNQEDEQQQQNSEGFFSMDDILDLLNNHQEEVTDMGLARTVCPNNVDADDLDSLHNLLHPGFNEADILDRILQQAKETGDPAALPPNEGYFSTDYVQNVGFLELADLESPLDGPSPSDITGSQQSEMFRPNSWYGVEGQITAGLEQHGGCPWKNPRTRVHGTVDVTSMDNTKSLGMVDRQLSDEVPQIISEGLGVVDNTYSSLVTSDDGLCTLDDLPSGSGLSLDEEGSLPFFVPDDVSTGSMYRRAGQFSIDSGCSISDKAGSKERSLDDESINTARSSAPITPSSPSILAKVLSGFLGKVNVLPASAAELAITPGPCKPLPKGRLKGFEDEVKLQEACRLSLTSRKLSVSPLDVNEVSGRHGTEVECAPMSDLKSAKGVGSGLSVFLFWIATLALILFYFFRGFSRSTRCAFSVVL